MRARAVALSVLGCAAALVTTWQLGEHASIQAGGPSPATSPGRTDAGPSTATPRPTSTAGASGATTPAPKRTGSSPSGSFAGASESTRYGQVQVEIIVRSGRITDVRALHLTDQGGRSVAISARAAPILRSEALKAQSAKIDAVSGATYTSEGYLTSLQAAIDKAGLK
jgi:uncharacterized protein with FMN-binding domain